MNSTSAAAAWAIAHVPGARRRFAGRRPGSVTVTEASSAVADARVHVYRPRDAGQPGAERALVLYFPPSDDLRMLGHRAGDWLCGSLAADLAVPVVRVAVDDTAVDPAAAGYAAVAWAAAGHPHAQLAVLGARDGGSLAARVAMLARDEFVHATSGLDKPSSSLAQPEPGAAAQPEARPHLERQALLSPDFSLLAGPPATADALATSLVARLSELPPTLLQRPAATSAQLGGENLAVLLREAGVAVREIEYPEGSLTWASYPRAVSFSRRALDDLTAFLRRGLLDDGFDVVPAWNVH